MLLIFSALVGIHIYFIYAVYGQSPSIMKPIAHLHQVSKVRKKNGTVAYVQNSRWAWLGLINPLNAELNPICHLLALLEGHHIFHVSGLRVKKQDMKGYVGMG